MQESKSGSDIATRFYAIKISTVSCLVFRRKTGFGLESVGPRIMQDRLFLFLMTAFLSNDCGLFIAASLESSSSSG